LMLVASPSSGSKSRSLRFAPAVAAVATDTMDSAGDAARASRDATDAFRGTPSREVAVLFRTPGRMLERPAAGLEGGAIVVCLRSIRSTLYVLLIVVSIGS
jgi:hypothetical protein